MLELVFVIVILGIVASIGSELIAKVYESYIVQRAEHRATFKTELAATQIANRLASAIPGTVYRIRKNTNAYEPIDSSFPTGTSGDDYKGIQWVSADMDSFSAASTPGWSGFCDINTSGEQNISTPGSNLGFANTVISNLQGNIANAAIYFPYDNTEHNVSSVSGAAILLDNNVSHIVEHYKLAWTSYALVCENGGTNYCGDLTLYYNFTPTPQFPYANASSSVLIKNVTTFKFKGAGRTIRFKICKEEPISEDVNITACKEKAVF